MARKKGLFSKGNSKSDLRSSKNQEKETKKRGKEEEDEVEEEEFEQQQTPAKKQTTTSNVNNNNHGNDLDESFDDSSLHNTFVSAGIPLADALRYEQSFQENDITVDMIPDLTYELLRQLEVKVGHQMKIMKINRKPEKKASKRKVQQESEDEDESQNNEDSMDLVSSTDALPVLQSDKKKEVDGKKKKGGKQKVDQQEIRRKVRAAVQKQKSNTPTTGFGFGASSVVSKYNIEAESIYEEVKKGKDFMLSQHDTQSALSSFEAITDEFVNVGTEYGENNITRYTEVLGVIAQAWVDILLSKNCKLDNSARSIWENRLIIWEKSPDPEHGTFTDARWACKHGWHDTLLNNVLSGDHIGKFYEPTGLVISRLNMLERDDDAQSALNLAVAVDLHNYAAKFLIKLGKVKEAETTALKLKDPAAAFSLAQVARPLDSNVAFNIALHSLVISDTWNNESVERAAWLCELAVSQKFLKDLVKSCKLRIKNKTIQFEIAKVLQRLEQLDSAMELAQIVIKPYTAEEIQKMKEEKIIEKEVKPTDTAQINILNDQVDNAAKVPRALAKWVWELAYDREQTGRITKDKLNEHLQLILDNVEEVPQLIEISQDMNGKAEYGLILKVGEKCLDLLDKQSKKSLEDKKEYLTRAHQIKLLKAEQDQLLAKRKQLSKQKEKQLSDLLLQQSLSVVSPHYDASFDNSKLQVCRIMIQAALDSKISPVLEKQMKQPEIDHVINTTLNSLKDVNHMIQLAEEMRARNEYEYILKFCQRAQETIKKLVGDYKKRESIKEELYGLRNEQTELQQRREHLDAKKLDRLHDLELEESLFALLPHYATTPNQDNLNLQAAKLMVTASLDIKARSILELIKDPSLGTEAQLDEEIWKVIETCLKYVRSPSHMMQLGSLLKDREAYTLVLKLDQNIIIRIKELRDKYLERQKPIQHLNVLREEQDFLNGMNKSLEKEQLDLLLKLEEEVKKLPKLAAYDPQSSDEYDKLALQVAQQMLGTVYDSKQKMEAKIAKDLEMSEQQIDKERATKTQEFENTLKEALKTDVVQNPNYMLTIANTFNSWKEHFLVLLTGNVGLKRIEEVRSIQLKRFPVDNELFALRQEKEKLSQHRKLLPADQLNRWRELELNEKLYKQKSSYLLAPIRNIDKLIEDIAQLMMKSILDSKDNYEQKIENDFENLISKERRESERALIQGHVDNTVNVCLNYLQDPNHLFKIAKSVSDRSRKEVEIVFKFGEQTQAKIKEINELRKVRAPLQNQIDVLKTEIQNLEKSKKPVPAEQSTELERLEKEISKLPKYPHFSDLHNYNEYDSLNIKIVQVLILVALDYRVQLDNQIKYNVENTEKVAQLLEEKDRISEQIENIVQLALTNVVDPEMLQKFQSDIKTRHEAGYVIEVGEKCIDRIKTLEGMREVRAPLEKQLDSLKKEQENLALLKKKLTSDQEKQMKKLEEKISTLPEWPYYANLHNYQQYSPLILSVTQSMLLVVLDNKQTLENKVATMIATEDPSYDEEKVNEERELIESQLRQVADFILKNVQNPDQLYNLETDLQNRKEVSLVIEVDERLHTLVSKLEEMRKVRAPLQEQIDKLRKEEQVLKEKRKTLSSEQQAQLQQLEKQVTGLPKWPYFASLFNYYQYNDLNLKASQAVIYSVLDAKSSLEAQVQQWMLEDAFAMHEEEVKEKRAIIEEQLSRATELALTYLRNPPHFNSIASDLKNRDEIDKALEIAEKLYETAKEIDDMRDIRAPIQKQINQIREEEAQLLAQKKSLSSQQLKSLSELEEKLKKLPDWPYFASLFSYHQYDRLVLSISELIVVAYLDKRDNIEDQYKRQMLEDPQNVNHGYFAKQRAEVKEKIERSVNLCLEYVHDPNLLLQYQRTVSHRQANITLKVATKAHERITDIENIRQNKDRIQEQLTLLVEEKDQLESQKKQLSPELTKQLEALQEELNKLRIPDYVSTSNQHDTLQYEIANVVLESVWRHKASIEAKLQANEEERTLSDEQVANLKKTIEEETESAVAIFTNNVYNPHHLLNFSRQMKLHNEFDIVTEVGSKCQKILAKLEKQRKLREQPMKQLVKLREEKEILENQRKHLPHQQAEELRALELEQRLLMLMPSYVYCDSSVYDDINYEIALEKVVTLLNQRNEFEAKVAMEEDKDQSELEEQRNQMKEELSIILDDGLKRISHVPNFLKFAREMEYKKEYQLVIRIAEACESRLDQLRKELEDRENLQLAQKELEDKILLQKDGATTEQQAKLDEIKQALDALPVEFEDKSTLDDYTLQISDLAIRSAKIEDNDDVLRTQTTLAFMVETTPDRWNQVKRLTSEHEWEEVKKELVVYLLKASTNPEEKNYIDPAVKVDLLLTEGLWNECLEMFPRPSHKEGEVELLCKLWTECEKNNPTELLKLHPTLERYVKRYFSEFRHQELDKLMDQVQRRFPDTVISLFEKGADVMMVTIMPSQYSQYVQFLRTWNKRIVNVIGKRNDWEKWLALFKATHKGKKKLMGMVNMLSDSSWAPLENIKKKH